VRLTRLRNTILTAIFASTFSRGQDHWQTINALADLIQARGKIQGTDPDVKRITDTIEPLPMEQEIATEWVLKPYFGEFD
jgi:hypothetical protein